MTKKDNPMTMISIRLPEDMVTELKKIAPLVGESGYQPLIRSYIEQGLAQDIKRTEKTEPIGYVDDLAQPKDLRSTPILAESRAEYTVERPSHFAASLPTEQTRIMENKRENKAWGKNLVALLKSFDETGWEYVGDSVEWVEAERAKRIEEREKRL